MLADRVRKVTHYLDPALLEGLKGLVRRKGGHGAGVTLSGEVAMAIRSHLARAQAQQEDAILAPIYGQVLDEKLGYMETWLRPMLANTGIHAAAATLLALEVLAGTEIQPKDAKRFLAMIKGRAYRLLKRRADEPDEEDTT